MVSLFFWYCKTEYKIYNIENVIYWMKNLPLVAVRDNNKRHIEILKTNIPTAVALQMCNLKTRYAGNFRI